MRNVKLALIAVFLCSVMVVSAYAVAYVVIQWTTTATVVANPHVCFVDWADGTTKANTFDYDVNIFGSVRTIDENITYGIWNWDAANHTIYMRINGITTDTNIANVTSLVENGAGATQITVTWVTSGGLPTTYQSFNALALTKYTIHTEILGTASPTGSSVITYDLKVDSP